MEEGVGSEGWRESERWKRVLVRLVLYVKVVLLVVLMVELVNEISGRIRSC